MKQQYEITTLEETPDRVLPFVRTIAIKAPVRAKMAACGYTPAEQAYAWRLLAVASGIEPAAPFNSDDAKARAAIAELDDWDGQGFARIQAALERLHPEQAAFVFAGIAAGSGIDSVLAVGTLLDRLDALEGAPEREATREADHAALATIAQRGIDRDEQARLRQLVELAQRAPTEFPETPSEREQRRLEALAELRAWYDDWSATARAVIQRRDYLIMLGLASRRSSSEAATTSSPSNGAAAAA